MPASATPTPSSAAAADGTAHQDRFHSLDALRAGLFLMILYSHTIIEPALVTQNGIETALLQIAWSGVQGFFVLSGFIITNLLVREFQRSGTVDVLAFYRRRALKILPPLAVMVAGVAVLIGQGTLADPRAWNALPLPGTPAAAETWRALPWMLGLVGNIPYALGLISITPALLIIWTLCVEEQFYLVHPWVVRATGAALASPRAFRIIALLIGAVLVARLIVYLGLSWAGLGPDTGWRVIYVLTLFQLDSLLCGVAVAVLAATPGTVERIFANPTRRAVIAVVAVAGLPILASAWRSRNWWAEPMLLSLINIYFGLLILWLLHLDRRIGTHRVTRSLAHVGRNGYCLYLVHQIALLTAFALLAWLALELPVRMHFWLRLAVALVLSLVLAQLLYWSAEQPLQRFRRPAAPPH
jgi:peptidoglycan/LPS O-acetylase OafA/YrhL